MPAPFDADPSLRGRGVRFQQEVGKALRSGAGNSGWIAICLLGVGAIGSLVAAPHVGPPMHRSPLSCLRIQERLPDYNGLATADYVHGMQQAPPPNGTQHRFHTRDG